MEPKDIKIYPVGTLVAWTDNVQPIIGVIVKQKYEFSGNSYYVKWFEIDSTGSLPVFGQTTIDRCVYDFQRLTRG